MYHLNIYILNKADSLYSTVQAANHMAERVQQREHQAQQVKNNWRVDSILLPHAAKI